MFQKHPKFKNYFNLGTFKMHNLKKVSDKVMTTLNHMISILKEENLHMAMLDSLVKIHENIQISPSDYKVLIK